MENINILDIIIINETIINFYRLNPDKAKDDYEILTTNSRGLDKSTLTGYYEKHHIIPKCLGGEDIESNYVLLTYREHILAHMLLYILYPEDPGLTFAFKLLIDAKDMKDNEVNVDLSILESLKAYSIQHNYSKSPEVRNAIRISQLGDRNNAKLPSAREKNRLWHLGRKDSEETKKKKSEAQKRRNQKETYSEEAKEKISVKNGQKVRFPNGEVFNSMTKASESLGISRHMLWKLIKNDSSGYELL